MKIQSNPEIAAALSAYGDYVAGQVLADSIELADRVEGTEFDFDGFKVNVNIQKTNQK